MAQNILLIEDDASDADVVREALINSSDGPFKVVWVRRCSEGLERLTREGEQGADSIAAVLVDLFLPDSHGIETFDRLFLAAPHIPILVLSASQDEDIAKLAVQRGAQDYLLKARLDGYLLPKALDQHGRARGERRGVVRRKRARTSHAQFHRRRGHEHRRRGQCDLSQRRRRKHDGLVARRRPRAIRSRKCSESSMPTTREAVQNPMALGDSGKQDRRPHPELHPDPARRGGSRHRRFRRAHPRSPGTGHRRRHGVSRRERGAGAVAQDVLSGPARRPHRSAQPTLVERPADPGDGPGSPSSAESWRCCSWTWIASSTSTTPWATSSATACCSPWRSACSLACADRTPSAGREAMNSWSCSRK